MPCHPWEHGNRSGRTKAKKVLISSSSSAAKTHTANHPPRSTANAKDASPDSTETRLKLWCSRSCKPQKPLPLALSHWQPLQRHSFTRLRVSEGLLKTTEATEKFGNDSLLIMLFLLRGGCGCKTREVALPSEKKRRRRSSLKDDSCSQSYSTQKEKKTIEEKKKTKVVSGSSLCCWLLSIGLGERSAAPMPLSCGFNWSLWWAGVCVCV